MLKKILLVLIVVTVSTAPVYACQEEKEISTPESKFSRVTRCHDRTPPTVTWVKIEKGELLWSAINGSKVEVRFSENKNDLRWKFKTRNDGHQMLGTTDTTGVLSGTYFFQMRTLEGCKKGAWSEVFSQTF